MRVSISANVKFRKVKIFLLVIIVAFEIGCSVKKEQYAEISFLSFLNKTYNKYKDDISEREKFKYSLFCSKMLLDHNNKENRDKYLKLLFLHRLFTSRGIDKGNIEGGILRIPYFPQLQQRRSERKGILYLFNKTRLGSMKPLKKYKNYPSVANILKIYSRKSLQQLKKENYTFADTFRLPSILLYDLLSNKEKYYCENITEDRFYTFSMCTEREITFLSITNQLGYKGSLILVNGNHMHSYFYEKFYTKENNEVNILLIVDNTFGIFRAEGIYSSTALKKWFRKNNTAWKYYRWYKKHLQNKKENLFVRKLIIPVYAQKRIEDLVQDYY